MSWAESADGTGTGIASYRVLRNGVHVSTVASPSTSIYDSGLAPGTTYSYTIVAVDNAGNQSGPTAAVSATTPARESLPQALNVTPKMDLLIFDASLMQMTEVAYEVRGSATYMVGSEESPPGEGYVYDTFLNDLVSNPSITPRQFGSQIVTRTLEAYGTNNNLTQSNIELAKMDAVASSLSAFGASLQNHIADSRTVMQNGALCAKGGGELVRPERTRA